MERKWRALTDLKELGENYECWMFGFWVLGVRCWVLNVECWVLNVECWMLDVECWMKISN